MTYWSCFLPNAYEDTTLATEVQRTSGFIPIKTVPRLHLTINETHKRSTKSRCRVLHKHLPKYQ